MEPPEPITLIEPIIPKRGMFGSVLKGWIPQPIFDKVTGWFGGERNLILFVAATAVTVGVVKVVIHIKKQNRRKKWNSVGKDVVVLHTIMRGKYTPCLSPFGLKLETYLRLADIKYEVDFSEPMGPKGKLPWITLNGESIGDSQLIMEMLGQKFQKNLSSHLTLEEKSVARAMRIMTEEHLFWCWEYWMFLVENGRGFISLINLPTSQRVFFTLLRPMMIKKMKRVTCAVGVGRHTPQEVEDMGRQDIAALSSWLGDKKFFMGDKPTEVDCAIFGFVAQLVWNFPDSPYGKMVKGEYSNLTVFCHQMKNTIWPDWNKHLDPPRA